MLNYLSIMHLKKWKIDHGEFYNLMTKYAA